MCCNGGAMIVQHEKAGCFTKCVSSCNKKTQSIHKSQPFALPLETNGKFLFYWFLLHAFLDFTIWLEGIR